jgi:hypothetical protein
MLASIVTRMLGLTKRYSGVDMRINFLKNTTGTGTVTPKT